MSATPYDIIIAGGTVIDPANAMHELSNVALKEGRVAAVGADLDPAEAVRCIDATDCIVVPGLIDLHTHVYKDVSMFGIEADELCPATGVTTAIDTGSAGWINYRGLERYVIERSRTRILAYVNLSGVGLPWRRGEMVYEGYVQPDMCARTVTQHPDTALGVKVRLYRGVGGDADLRDLLQLALDAAIGCDRPLMVHITGGDVPLSEWLPLLRKDDIITHCFHASEPATILDSAGRVLPEVRDARDRGVVFDIGHGLGSFSFEICRRALEDGFPPDTISSDIHTLNIDGPVYDLPTTMTKFLSLGMPLEEVIRRTTIEPARVIGRADELGRLGAGAAGDVAVLSLEEGSYQLEDSEEDILQTGQKLVCKATVRNGEVWWEKA